MLEDDTNIELRSSEFQDVLEAIPLWICRWGITILAIIIIVFTIGSAVYKYPDILTTNFVLTTTNPSTDIMAMSSGKIKEIYIENEQNVTFNEYLAVIENSATTKDMIYLKEYLQHFDLKSDSLELVYPSKINLGDVQQLYSSFYISLSKYKEVLQNKYYEKKTSYAGMKASQYIDYRNELQSQKDIIQEQYEITKNQYKRDSLLNKKGVIAFEELEETKNKFLQNKVSLKNINLSIADTELKITLSNEESLDVYNEYTEKINELESQLKGFVTQLQTEIKNWELKYVFLAPVDGKIIFTNYWSINQNVTQGAKVFNIIPVNAGELIGKASLPIERSGKVSPGQRVNIRFQNFPDEEYGIIIGTVRKISQIPSIDDNNIAYIVEVGLVNGLTTTYNKKLPMMHQMMGRADIITEERTLLDRIFSPLKKEFKEHIYVE